MNSLKLFSKADYVSFIGIALSIASIFLLLEGKTEVAVGIMIFSVVFDFADGMVARKYGGSKYGSIVDTIYDLIGFLIFPALLVFQTVNCNEYLLAALGIAFILSGVARLAIFTVIDPKEKSKGYVGMPVFYSLIAVLAYQIADGYVSVAVLAAMTLLMNTSINFAKPRHPAFFALIIATSAYFLWIA